MKRSLYRRDNYLERALGTNEVGNLAILPLILRWEIYPTMQTGAGGACYFDAFESRRTTYIGPQAGMRSFELGKSPAWTNGRL